MGQSIAGKGNLTQNVAMLSIKSTSSLRLRLLLHKKKTKTKKKTVERLFPGKL